MKKIKTTLLVLASVLLLQVGCSSQTASPQTAEAKSQTNVEKPQTKQTSGSSNASGNDLQVYYFDVNQGDSILIRTPSKADVLIDGGNNDQGYRLVKYLKDLHVDHLEAVIATHPDADHVGGLDSVLAAFKVNNVYAPKVTHNTKTFEDFIKAVKKQNLSIKIAKSGVTMPLEGVETKFVGAEKDNYEDMNDYSAVLHLTYGQTSFLFTGDAPVNSEKEMMAAGENLKADVLKVGHHGASTSSSPEFLKAVGAKYGVISVGKDNKYHHPTDKTLNALKKANVQVFRTDEQGTIEAISDGKKVTMKTER
jgi:competence protein ComEC